MSIYARIFEGMVVEIILPAAYPAASPDGVNPTWSEGDEIPIKSRFTPEFIATLVDISSTSPQPTYGWIATESDGNWSFNPPPEQTYS